MDVRWHLILLCPLQSVVIAEEKVHFYLFIVNFDDLTTQNAGFVDNELILKLKPVCRETRFIRSVQCSYMIAYIYTSIIYNLIFLSFILSSSKKKNNVISHWSIFIVLSHEKSTMNRTFIETISILTMKFWFPFVCVYVSFRMCMRLLTA